MQEQLTGYTTLAGRQNVPNSSNQTVKYPFSEIKPAETSQHIGSLQEPIS